MVPRPFLGRARWRARSRRPLQVERLEDRCVPAVLTFTAPSGNGLDDMLLRRNGNKLELFNNGIRVRSQNLNSVSAVAITGASGEDDKLKIDFSAGGLFAVRDGITFTNGSGAGTDQLIVDGTNAANIVSLTAGGLTVDGSVIAHSGVEQLQVNLLAGADTVTMTGLSPATATTVDAGVDPSIDIDSFTGTFAGDFVGSLTLRHFDKVSLHVGGNFSGQLTVNGSGTIDELDIDGSVTDDSTVMAEDITMAMIMGDMDGTVTVASEEEGSGNIDTMIVGGDFTGDLTVEEMLETLTVDGGTTGTIDAGDIGTVSADEATAGSPVLEITEGGVTRRLIATRADNGDPTPSTVQFAYFYDSTGPGDPQLTVRVTNGSPATSADDVRFDLSLTTSTAAEFDLARLFAAGTSGLRSLAVEGDVLPTVSDAALAFFGLPAGTPGGVRLPLDALAAVAAQDNLVAGTLQVASLQAVAFGSLTAGSGTIPAEAATHVDAARLLAPGSSTVTANESFQVPFAEGRRVALFFDTGPSDFNVKNVLFADQIANNASVTAVVATAGGEITTVRLLGDGGSIQTEQPIRGAITSTGPLGDLTLGASNGIGDVTAPSIFGNISTNGPIHGTIQTTVGDLGRALRDASGTIIGTTIINTTQGIPGRIISRGNLISRVQSQKELTGLIAAQGDVGVAYVNAAGQLVRFGGIVSNGHLGGRIVVLGNVLGDIIAGSGLGARAAVRGRPIAGLASTRTGILGNFNVNGNVDAESAVVVGNPTGVPGNGLIGDAVGGTFFSSGSIRGILAAKGDINFGNTGSTSRAAIFENATGANAAAIDAIFTRNGGLPHGFDLAGQDLAGLDLILTDLAALRVGPGGNLTGPVA